MVFPFPDKKYKTFNLLIFNCLQNKSGKPIRQNELVFQAVETRIQGKKRSGYKRMRRTSTAAADVIPGSEFLYNFYLLRGYGFLV
jgi:hypothetical protein